jgi:hypothetical protein
MAAPTLMLAQQQSNECAELTGTLALDLQLLDAPAPAELQAPFDYRPPPGKSVWLAGALSAVVPGSGELYAEAPLWKTLLFAGLEVAGWTTWAVYENQGDMATDDFEHYADQNWDVTRYIDWIAANYQHWDDDQVDKETIAQALQTVFLSTDPNREPWQRVDFAQLRRIESAVRDGFSHTLPDFGEQQYYEQIGKYTQYRAGWSDHAGEVDTLIYDNSFVTQRNRDYMDLRAEANRLLGIASTAVGVVVLNHLVSMLDAAIEANGFNTRIEAQLLNQGVLDDGELYGRVGVRVRF